MCRHRDTDGRNHTQSLMTNKDRGGVVAQEREEKLKIEMTTINFETLHKIN